MLSQDFGCFTQVREVRQTEELSLHQLQGRLKHCLALHAVQAFTNLRWGRDTRFHEWY